MRSCIGCGQIKEKKELVRLVAETKGEVLLDLKQRLPGRGAYICYRADCLRGGLKKNRLAFRLKRKTVVLDEPGFQSQLRDQMEEKLFAVIKSGKVVVGTRPLEAGLGLVARDVSSERKRKLISYCQRRGVACQEMGTKEGFLKLTGGRASAFLFLAEREIGKDIKRGLSLLEEMGRGCR